MVKNLGKSWRVFGAALLLGASLTSLPATADTVRVGGTGSALGSMKILADAYQVSHPETTIVVVPSLGSSGGIKAVMAGALDLSLSGRLPKPEERSQAITEHQIARTPLVLASMRSHAGFSKSDVARVFEGTLRTWPDGSPLRPILRPESDSESALLRAISPEIARALDVAYKRPGVHIAITDQDSADAIERIPGALGVSTLALIISEQRKIKPLPLNGVAPSVDALARGRYPYFKPLYLITPKTPSESARAFVVFIQSPEGARILRASGFLPQEPAGK